MQERRRHRRYATSWTAEVEGSPSTRFIVEIANISEGGLGVVSVRPMRVGASYFFRITRWTDAPLKGSVKWVDGFEGPTYAGIEFADVTPEQLDALRALILKFDEEDWGGSA